MKKNSKSGEYQIEGFIEVWKCKVKMLHNILGLEGKQSLKLILRIWTTSKYKKWESKIDNFN